MTTAYQLGLFSRYDLVVELEWRRRLAEEVLQSAAPRSPEERLRGALADAEIYPIELSPSATVAVEPVEGFQSINQTRSCYTARYPFSGDEQLWHMNPGVDGDFPLGEVFRHELILTADAVSMVEAEAQFAARLKRTRDLVTLQTSAIEEFHSGLLYYLRCCLRSGSFYYPVRSH